MRWPASRRGDLRRHRYALIHGAGDVGWYWHLLEAELRERGHDTVAPDLPVEDDSAGLTDYADVVIDAIGERRNLIVVAQSFGGYVAPIVCDRLPARLLVLVAGMVPVPGETAEEMFANTGWKQEQRTTPARSRSSTTMSRQTSPPRRWPADAPNRALRARNPGRCERGRTCPHDFCSVGTTVSSRPHGWGGWCGTASGSRPMKSTAAIAPR